jgi:hypothetical protein
MQHIKAALFAMTVKTAGKTHAGSLNCRGWGGIARFMPNRWLARIAERFLLRASFCKASFSTLNRASAGCCAARTERLNVGSQSRKV